MKLTWKVSKSVSAPCPDYTPNPYTGEYPSFHCAVIHYETITENKDRYFKTKKEAQDFADKAPWNCSDFRLDGKLLKDNRPKEIYTDLSNGSSTAIINVSANNLVTTE